MQIFYTTFYLETTNIIELKSQIKYALFKILRVR